MEQSQPKLLLMRLLWPEMVELLKKEGIGNFSIFLDEDTNTLFAYQEQKGDNSPVSIPLEQLI
jgi:L-rhamnose mutarotase